MIIPNLMVTDVGRSIAFYRDKVGLSLAMTVGADRSFAQGGMVADPVFAIMEGLDGQLMLQSVASLAADVPDFAPDQTPTPGGTIYFRGVSAAEAEPRFDGAEIVKPPERSWYGMVELYVRDPDGHVLCLGAPDGPPPR